MKYWMLNSQDGNLSCSGVLIPFGHHICGNLVTTKKDFSPIFSPILPYLNRYNRVQPNSTNSKHTAIPKLVFVRLMNLGFNFFSLWENTENSYHVISKIWSSIIGAWNWKRPMWKNKLTLQYWQRCAFHLQNGNNQIDFFVMWISYQ